MPTIISVDPGLSGSVVWGTSVHDVTFCNMPATPKELSDLIRDILKDADRPVAYLEKVNGYGGNDAATAQSGFVFGHNVGQIEALLATFEIPTERPTPQAWQKALGCGNKMGRSKSQWKQSLRTKAIGLYPSQRITLKNADAFLIYHAAVKGLI